MLSLPDFNAKKWVIIHPNEGQKLSIKNDNVIVTDENNKIVLQLTCYQIFTIWIVGSTTLTTVLMERSKKFGFSIFILNGNMKTIGHWNASTEGNYLLRKVQYNYDEIDIAKRLVKNKLYNQNSLLKSIRIKDDELKEAIKKIDGYQLDLETCSDEFSLLGIEGVGSKLFFRNWFKEFDWNGRKPRAKRDPMNVLMDIGYTILFNFIDSLLDLYGFDKYKGVYHKVFYQRKSLVCDIIEPFRCIIDKQIVKAFNLQQVKEDDFDEIKGQYRLKFQKNKDVQKIFVPVILDRKEEIFLYVQSYYRAFMRSKSIEDYPFFKLIN